MQLVRVGAAALNQTPHAWDDNRRHIECAIDAARAAGVSLLCLPELCISGYGCEDSFLSPGLWRSSLSVLREIAPKCRGMVVAVGLPLSVCDALYDAAALLVDGQVVGFACKRYLAGDGIHYEPRWFKPWPVGERSTVDIAGESLPVGDLLFDCGGIKIGFEICEDAWVASRPGAQLAQAGCDVILSPSASHFAFGKVDVRRRLALEGSRAFGVAYVYANLLGNEAGRAIYDGGAMIAAGGAMLAEGDRFSFRDWQLTTAVVDIELLRGIKTRAASRLPDHTAASRLASGVAFDWPRLPASDFVAPSQRKDGEVVVAARTADPSSSQGDWRRSPVLKHEEFARAEAIGLFDYLRKSRSLGFVVSISGGVDSAAVSTLVSLMVRFGVAELGLSGFKAKLAHIAAIADATSERALVERLLSCVYQSTKNSGEVTRAAARGVAAAIGARFHEFDVDPIVTAYTELAAGAESRALNWNRDDVALQNIQARARAPGVWMLANLRGALLLSTSNRSEAAVGYCTMDGDTAGSLSPIAGIDKHYLRQWLRWMETTGPCGAGPIPELRAVNEQAPTAELRPTAASQTDEADLMPYDLLDAVERAAIRDKRMPVEVFDLMRAAFPQHSSADLATWVERFFRLWCRNQWKRERYAPSFHLDDENLDPKTWCRFPILSGGYERELVELRRHASERR